jgi:hypothetical protein
LPSSDQRVHAPTPEGLADHDLTLREGPVRDLNERTELGAAALLDVFEVSLPELDGVPLSFTDLTAHPELGLLFTATAEDTQSTYDDGVCAGSVLGRLQGTEVCDVRVFSQIVKIEGIAWLPQTGAGLELRLVSDADERQEPSQLFSAQLSLRS